MLESSKQDGSYNKTFKASFVDEIILIKGDEVIRGKKKGSQSQKLRQAIFAKGIEYEPFMNYLLKNLDELTNEYEQIQITD